LVDIDQVGLEETFGGLEALTANTNDTTIGEGVRLDKNGGILGELLVQLEIVGDVSELLLDLTHGLEIGGSVERIAAAEKERNKVAGDIATSDIQSTDVMVQYGRLVHGDDVCDTVTGINNHTAAQTYDRISIDPPLGAMSL
jgi:hypothetical protein